MMMVILKVIWQMIAVLMSIMILVVVTSALITLILSIAKGKDEE